MLCRLRVALIFLACPFLLVARCTAQFGVPLNHTDARLEPATVRELVAKYCRIDYAGARLNAVDWPKLQPLVGWPTNPDYSLFMTTSRFDVETDPVSDHGKYTLVVHYRLLGKYDLAEGYSVEAANKVQDVRYVISEVNGDWRITEIEPSYPHPSRAATLQWLNGKLAQTQDPVAKTIYQNAISRLQGQNVSPLAK